MNGSKLRAIVLLTAVLAAGFAMGFLFHHHDRHSKRGKVRGTDRVVERLNKELQLDAAQRDAVRAILERRRADVDSLSAEVHPRFEAIRSMANTQIESVLTPAQREKFREDLQQREERRQKRRERRNSDDEKTHR